MNHENMLFVIEFCWCEFVTREEQVLCVDGIDNWVAREIDFEGPCAIAVVGKVLVAWLDVFTCPGGGPPACGDTYLWTFRLHV